MGKKTGRPKSDDQNTSFMLKLQRKKLLLMIYSQIQNFLKTLDEAFLAKHRIQKGPRKQGKNLVNDQKILQILKGQDKDLEGFFTLIENQIPNKEYQIFQNFERQKIPQVFLETFHELWHYFYLFEMKKKLQLSTQQVFVLCLISLKNRKCLNVSNLDLMMVKKEEIKEMIKFGVKKVKEQYQKIQSIPRQEIYMESQNLKKIKSISKTQKGKSKMPCIKNMSQKNPQGKDSQQQPYNIKKAEENLQQVIQRLNLCLAQYVCYSYDYALYASTKSDFLQELNLQ